LGDRVSARLEHYSSLRHPGRFFIALALMIALASGSTALSAPKVKSFDIIGTHFPGSLWNESHARASIVS